MYSGAKLKYKIQSMDLIAFTMPAPDNLIVTLVEKSETDDALLPLPNEAKAHLLEILTDASIVRSMTSIKVPETKLNGFTADVIIPMPGGTVQPIADGE